VAPDKARSWLNQEKIMSTFIRSAAVVAALMGTVSAASAVEYGYGYGSGSDKAPAQQQTNGKSWVKAEGAQKKPMQKKHDARAFFDKLQKEGN
jgi:hypothetical protein